MFYAVDTGKPVSISFSITKCEYITATYKYYPSIDSGDLMLWIVFGIITLFFMVLLYSCVVVASRADRDLNEIMKKIRKKD